MTTVRGPLLIAAAISMGLVAGVFGLYAHTIMRGLHKTDDRTFVTAFQQIDKAIINPIFMVTFFGALICSGAAVLLYMRDDGSSVVPWVGAAFVLYLVGVVITMAVNVPLNDDIKNAGDPATITDFAAVRDAFHESRWVAWNVVRTITTTVAFGLLTWALVLHGRLDEDKSSDDSAPATSTSTSTSAFDS